jgi:serine protease
MTTPQRPGCRWILAWPALALAACAATAAPPPLAEPLAMGLIVRLKNAPSHQAAPVDATGRATPLARREAARWAALLRDAALSGASGQREPVQRAVGRDQRLLDFGRGLTADEAERVAARLRRDPRVDWVAPNLRERRMQVSSDPLSAQQWWLLPAGGSDANAITERLRGVPGFLSAWRSGIPGAMGSAQAIVAVLDTGLTSHPDLAGRTLPGYDFVSDAVYANDGDGRDSDPADPGDWVSAADKAGDARFSGCEEERSSWHGTIITGIVAAATDNDLGVAGIAPQGRVLPVRVAGKCGAAVADIVDGMRWAAGLPVPGVPANPHPARILNVSFGGNTACGPEYQTVIDELRVHGAGGLGTLVVAAAGNGHGAVSRPASCRGVVGVAALNRDGFKTCYSNFGGELAATGIATVGGDDDQGGAWHDLLADSGIVSVWNTGTQSPAQAQYAALFGTSFAAPMVSGTLGLMLGVNPALSVDELLAGLARSARPHVTSPLIGECSADNPGRCICSSAHCGVGILDAAQAVLFAAHPATYVPPVRWPEVIANAEVAQAKARGLDLPPGTAVVVQAPASSGGGAAAPGWVLALGAAWWGLRRRA